MNVFKALKEWINIEQRQLIDREWVMIDLVTDKQKKNKTAKKMGILLKTDTKVVRKG